MIVMATKSFNGGFKKALENSSIVTPIISVSLTYYLTNITNQKAKVCAQRKKFSQLFLRESYLQLGKHQDNNFESHTPLRSAFTDRAKHAFFYCESAS